MYSTQCAQDTARDAVQIFGGRGVTQTGMGRFIEHVRCHLSVQMSSCSLPFVAHSITGQFRLIRFWEEVRLH
jgi:alkylation response protein AidB-like acyl-CoA dehydrogenase